MNSKLRWQLHRAVEENFDGLFTFSVGEENCERVVVCRLPAILGKISSGECTHEKALLWAHSKHGCRGPLKQAFSGREVWNNRQRMKTMQETSSHLQGHSSRDGSRSQNQNEIRKTSRRPDIQLYVPRARRSAPTALSSTTDQLYIESPSSSRSKSKDIPKNCPTESQCGKGGSNDHPITEVLQCSRKLADVSLPKATTLSNDKMSDLRTDSPTCNIGKHVDSARNVNIASQSAVLTEHKPVEVGPRTINDKPSSDKHRTPSCDYSHENGNSECSANCTLSADPLPKEHKVLCENEMPEEVILFTETVSQQENQLGALSKSQDVKECSPKRTVPVRTVHQKLVSPSPDTSKLVSKAEENNACLQSAESCQKPCFGETRHSVPDVLVPERNNRALSSPALPKESTEKESWDNMFDENGECLHPSVLDGLKSALGKTEIRKPKFDYLVFEPPEPDLSDECYDHVLEIYDFPAEFKTQNLMMAFSSFKDRGFDIKWVDDTHALAIFSSPLAAAEALDLQNPFIKTRPVSQATSKSKFKLSKNLEYLLPSRPRPETSALRARRMITGALGMRSSVSKEERETERRKLQAAKENKRQVAKQKQDIWNGTVS